jgi:alkanesulfonate monooxygenase SsuD/methylene tetrahydromethanopterin reductase-like flavin-dependent oxidoreductase (luciferase family)
MVCINVIAADTDAEARRLFTSLQQTFLALRRGKPRQLPPPVDDIDAHCSPAEKAMIDQALSRSIVGSPSTVRDRLQDFVAEVRPDEIMVGANIFDHATRLRSFELVANR